MGIDNGTKKFPAGTDVTLDIKIEGEKKDISPTGENWTFVLTVRLNPSDTDVVFTTTSVTFNEVGDADTDPEIQIIIGDEETDAWVRALLPPTADGEYAQHTHVWDCWRTNAGFDNQIARGTFIVTEPVSAVV